MSETTSDPSHTDSPSCNCFKCKIKTIQLSPRATPSRTWRPQTGLKDSNSYEKGIPTDSRGMPYLDSNGKVMYQKEYDSRKSEIEAAKRQYKNEGVN